MNNSQVFEDNLGPRVKSSIGEDRTYFPGYTTSELYKIVGDRAKNAFKPDMYTEESITRIVSLIGSESGDARKAIDLLRVAGETANKKESKITQEIVREAYSGITTDWIIDQIRDLPHKYQTVLSNIATNQLNGKEITVRLLVEAFEARDESYSQRRVQEIIKNLETLGYLESWIVSRGRHGRRKYIRTIHNAETIENFFEENR
jgi:cell division control protein 6